MPGESGCCGRNVPISHFLLSLTHSAMLIHAPFDILFITIVTAQGEVEDLVELLMKHNQKDFKMDTVFGIPVINILWTIVAGQWSGGGNDIDGKIS